MRITKKKKVETEVTTGFKCDTCKKVVNEDDTFYYSVVDKSGIEYETDWYDVCFRL